MPSIRLIATLAATSALGVAGTADAGTFCVGDAPGCPADPVPLASALTEAQATEGHDEILIGPGTYAAGSGFEYETDDPANTVRIRGAGPTQTIIAPSTSTKSGDFSTLRVKAAGKSIVEDLAVAAPGNANVNADTRALALQGPVTASQVRVTGGAPAPSEGVLLDGATLSDSEVKLPWDAVAVEIDGNGTSTVQRSHLDARIGVRNQLAGPTKVHDTRIDADLYGLVNENGAGISAADAVIRMTKPGGAALRAKATSAAAKLSASHLTIHGASTGTIGVSTVADNGADASVSLDNSIIAGVATGVSRYSDAPGSDATVTLHTVNYDLADDEGTGLGVISRTAITNVDPVFAGAAAGDLRLLRTSPLLDGAREPAFVDPGPQALNGMRTTGPQSDLGAFEYQRSVPTAVLDGPASVVAGTAVTFSAAKSTANDPGDEVADWSWSFGDGAKATGTATPAHTFDAPGKHKVQLTVKDLDGKLAIAERWIVVTPAPVATGGGDAGAAGSGESGSGPGEGGASRTGGTGEGLTPADRTAPVISSLQRRGRAVSFSLSEAAAVRVRIERRTRTRTFRAALATRKVAGRAGRNRVAIRTLRPGRYRIVVTALDAAGNRSVERRAFRVAR